MTIDIQFTASPLEEAESWDFVLIEDIKLPCLQDIPEFSVGRKVDAKGHAGSDDVTITDKGQKVNPVKITLHFYETEHFQTWDEIKDLISARKRASDRRPLAVYHPALSQQGINAIYTKEVSGMKFKKQGWYYVVIDGYEYRESQHRRRNTTRRAVTPSIVRTTAFTSTIAQSRQQTVASFASARPSQNGASNP